MQFYLHVLFMTYLYQCPLGSFNTHSDRRKKHYNYSKVVYLELVLKLPRTSAEIYLQMV